MSITLSALQQQRRDTAANWTSANPTLLAGELGYETDTGKWKVGDGSTAWTALAYTYWSQITAYPLATADIANDAITGDKLANDITIANDLVVTNNLTVNGTTTTVNSTTLTIDDKNIELGTVATPSDTTADGGGITLKGATDKTLTWVNSTDCWTFNQSLNLPAGSASTPALIFNGDVNTGLFQSAADEIAVATGGTQRLVIDSNGSATFANKIDLDVDTTNFRKGVRCHPDTEGTSFISIYGTGSGSNMAMQVYDGNAGTHKFRLYHDGSATFAENVGIGTTSLFSATGYGTLTLSGSTGGALALAEGSTKRFEIYGDNTNGLRVYDRTNTTERLRIDSSGRLLIGTTSDTAPAGFNAKLQIASTSYTGSISLRRDSNDAAGQSLVFGKSRGSLNGNTIVQNGDRLGSINFYGADGNNLNSDAAQIAVEVDGTPGATDMPGRILFKTTSDGASSPTERMRIDSSGQLGLGTSSPATRLQIGDTTVNSGNVITLGKRVTSAQGNLPVIGHTSDGTASDLGLCATSSSGAIRFFTGNNSTGFGTGDNTERMRVDGDGNFLVQTTGITEYATTSGAGSWGYTADTGSARGSIVHANNADNGWSMMYMNKFNWSHPDDGRYINFYKNGVGGPSIQLNSSGNVDYNTSSDYRLKENIVPMTNGITRLKQLLPKQFNMIDDPDNNLCDGFLAHEAQTVVPQAVCGTHNGMKTDEEGNEIPDYQGLDYGKLTPLLTAALQEAIAKIETLETKVAALEAQ